MVVVDTSIWIDYLRTSQSVASTKLDELLASSIEIALVDIVLLELLQGAPTDKAAARLEKSLSPFILLRSSELSDFRLAAKIYRDSRVRGLTIRRTIDCLIAAVCVRWDTPLLHNDADFDRIAEVSPLRVLR